MQEKPAQIHENSDEMAMALSLHVKNSDTVPEEEPVPLSVCKPPRGSSPRATSTGNEGVPFSLQLSETLEDQLRSSGGNQLQDSSLIGVNGGLPAVKGSMKRRCRSNEEGGLDELHESGEGSNAASGKSKKVVKKRNLGASSSRKSPRLNLEMVSELLALPGPGSGRVGSAKKCVTKVKLLRNRVVETPLQVTRGSARKGGARSGQLDKNVDKKKVDSVVKGSVQKGGRRNQQVEVKKVDSVRRIAAFGSGKGKNHSDVSQLESKLADSVSDFSVAGKRDIDVIEEGPVNRDVEPELRFILVNVNNSEPSGLDDRVESEGNECEMSEGAGNGGGVNLNDTSSSTPKKTEMGISVGKAELNSELIVSSERCLRTRKIPFQIGESDAKKSRKNKEGIIENKGCTPKSRESGKRESKQKATAYFIGLPIPEEEAQQRWGWRYELKSRQPKNKGWILNAGEEDEMILNVGSHYAQASVAGRLFNIGDCAFIKGEGKDKHIGRILEFFKTVEGEDYFRVQWFYKAVETVMKDQAAFHDKKRIFYSTIMNDNSLDCIISKVNIVELSHAIVTNTIPKADFYYDMEYCVDYSTFRNMKSSNDSLAEPTSASPVEATASGSLKGDLTLLDIFAGCGGMSTGLCIGAKLSGINLVKRWAVDLEKSACDSFKLNHPETQVRNVAAEDYLELLKSWEKLCQQYVLSDLKSPGDQEIISRSMADDCSELEKDPDGDFEVARILDICYGDPNETGKKEVYLQVRWKGYGQDDDTWEPLKGLSNCQECIKDFVQNGLRSKILPLPGEVGVICGGPPCQGISGYNRHRNFDEPLSDEKNHQLVVFMNIVEFLKPKYVLMENVVDILRLDGGSLGRYALSRLVHMKYQTRLGTIAAGCYGLAQFRLRVFLWGALPSEKLPPFPLPSHDVVVRYWPPSEFERNTVAYDEGQPRELEDALVLRDAISDLPPVTNDETREVMDYQLPPQSRFQEYIRLSREDMMGSQTAQINEATDQKLYDHRPYYLNEDNYLRVCQIPHRKGANFRDLPGLFVDQNNVVQRDTTMKDPVLPSGNLLVPDCSLKLDNGKSKRPFGRVWWDETVPTILTFPHFKNQAILHPDQDRVFTIREFARLQGFPDFYRFTGSTRERYSQIGNAVAIPVGRALGYGLGMAYQNLTNDEPLMTLPSDFASLRPKIDDIVELGS